MKIKLVSDLHLEFSDINIQNDQDYDVLILSGDICVAQDLHDHPEPNNSSDQEAIAKGTGLGRRQQAAQRFRDFFKRCSFQFPHVIYVMGNHEFYHGKFYAAIDYMRDEMAKFPNIYLLENDTKVIDDVVFVGGTLWTNMNKRDPLTMHAIEGMMNDFRIVRNDYRSYAPMSSLYLLENDTKVIDDVVFVGGTLWTNMNNRDPLTMHAIEGMMNDFRIVRNDYRSYAPMSSLDVAVRHDKTLAYIKIVLEQNKDKKCVVVGHHAPSMLSIHEQYAHDTLMNGGYASDLSEFILDHPQIKLWTHGHMHQPFDYVIGETRIVCNPRGYENDGYSEDSGWNPNILLEI